MRGQSDCPTSSHPELVRKPLSVRGRAATPAGAGNAPRWNWRIADRRPATRGPGLYRRVPTARQAYPRFARGEGLSVRRQITAAAPVTRCFVGSLRRKCTRGRVLQPLGLNGARQDLTPRPPGSSRSHGPRGDEALRIFTPTKAPTIVGDDTVRPITHTRRALTAAGRTRCAASPAARRARSTLWVSQTRTDRRTCNPHGGGRSRCGLGVKGSPAWTNMTRIAEAERSPSTPCSTNLAHLTAKSADQPDGWTLSSSVTGRSRPATDGETF